MERVKIGLIGLGFMGTTHFGIYKNCPGAQVVAIADVDERKRTGDISAVSGNIGDGEGSTMDMTGITAYADGMKMIAESDADVIDICVPTPFHADYVLAALKAGKHVFCEKPLCRNKEQMKAIRAALDEHPGQFFNVGMCVRAWPEYAHTKQLLDSGALGAVKIAHFRRLSPTVAGHAWNDWYAKEAMSGGAALDLHIHDTDIVCHYFGRPASVMSVGLRGGMSDTGIDHIITRYQFNDGRLVTAEGGWCAARNVPFEMSYRIICEKATVDMGPAGYKIYWNDGRIETPEVDNKTLPTGWHKELTYWIDCIKNGIKPDKYQNPQSVCDSFAVAMAEAESVDTGKEVEVSYV